MGRWMLLVFVALFGSALALAAEPRIVVKSEGGVLTALMEEEVPYAAERLWPPLSGYGSQHTWVPYMKTASLARTGPAGAVCTGSTDLPWLLKDRTWTVNMKAEVEQVDGRRRFVAWWQTVPGGGNLENSRGAWSLEELDGGGTRVRLEAMADVGVAVPAAMVRWAERRALPKMLQALLVQAGVQEP